MRRAVRKEMVAGGRFNFFLGSAAAVHIKINNCQIACRKSPLQYRSSVATSNFLPVVGSPWMCQSKELRTLERSF